MVVTAALSLALLSFASTGADAFVRMSCGSRLVDERIDPIVNPGVPSGHMHAINGGNGFNFDQPDGLIRRSTCSSCPIKEDLSAYWTPKLYYHNTTDDTYTAVPQAGDGYGKLGGQTVYYLQRGGPNNDKLKAFPENFRMIAGDPFKRHDSGDHEAEAISFNCLNYDNPQPETRYLPKQKCPQGLRAQVFFPACWDGQHVDSDDHKSHMAYPMENYNGGACPSTHPVHMISIFYEIIYSTDKFDDGWYDGDQQPFVFAMGDPTGYGFHGDFLNGWDVATLQALTDTCLDDSGVPAQCDKITFFTDDEMASCKIPPQIDEDIGDQQPIDELPGCNPPQAGPGDAAPVKPCARTGTIGDYESYGADVTASKGFRYLGCAPDDIGDRTFGEQHNDEAMTVEKCVDYCSQKGFSFAGTEYSTQCFCGNQLRADRQAVAGIIGNCGMKCGGDESQYCGGGGGLSLYQKCAAGEACENATFKPVT